MSPMSGIGDKTTEFAAVAVQPTSPNCPKINAVRLLPRTGSCFVCDDQVNSVRVSEENIPKKTSSSRRKKYLCQSVNHYDVKYLIEDL